MNCQICLFKEKTKTHLYHYNNTHHVYQDCDTKLKAHFVFACPRHPINENLKQNQQNNHFVVHIRYQLIFNI